MACRHAAWHRQSVDAAQLHRHRAPAHHPRAGAHPAAQAHPGARAPAAAHEVGRAQQPGTGVVAANGAVHPLGAPPGAGTGPPRRAGATQRREAGAAATRAAPPAALADRRTGPPAARRAGGDRLYAVYSVAIATGLRRGEVLGLRWTDVDLDARTLHVRASLQRLNGQLGLVEPKTKLSQRPVPLPEVCVAALHEHHARQAQDREQALVWLDEWGLVFTTKHGTPIEPRNLLRHFQATCQRIGLPRLRFHDYADLRIMPTERLKSLARGKHGALMSA
ncbi:MAG: site-specific integrase [Egibacteraceae bacterium]